MAVYINNALGNNEQQIKNQKFMSRWDDTADQKINFLENSFTLLCVQNQHNENNKRYSRETVGYR